MNKGKKLFWNLPDNVGIHQYLDKLIVFFAQKLLLKKA